MTMLEKINKQAQKLISKDKPAFLLHVSKKAMDKLAGELGIMPSPPTLELGSSNKIIVKKTQYLDNMAMEWSDITESQYRAWNGPSV